MDTDQITKIIKFGADHCQPCKVADKLIASLDNNVDGVPIEVLDIEDSESVQYIRKFGIRNIPTLVFLNEDGEKVDIKVGQQAIQYLNQQLKSA